MAIVNYDWDEREDNIDEEYDEAGTTIAEYTTEPSQYGTPISQYREAVYRQYSFDGQGSATELADHDGLVTDRLSYMAFGQITERIGNSVVAIRFRGAQGYYSHDEFSPVYIRRRFYAPDLGRWSSLDPIGFQSGDINLYRYVRARPTISSDPSGLQVCAGSRSSDAMSESIDRLAAASVAAGGGVLAGGAGAAACAAVVADGPLPIGDCIAVGIIVTVYIVAPCAARSCITTRWGCLSGSCFIWGCFCQDFRDRFGHVTRCQCVEGF